MKKTIIPVVALAIVVTFSMCNTPNTSGDADAQKAEMTDGTSEKKAENHASCMMPIAPGDSAKYLSKQVEVKGDVLHPLTLTVDSLKAMNAVTIENFNVVCASGATMKEDRTCKGVLLKDILEKAEIEQLNHKDRNFYIVARATDNYKATFSWAEIFNNPTGENVYILFEENGQPIKVQGDMILICKNDIKTGPRHVYWLSSIEVKRVD